jgi:hypothetical protein
MQNLQRRSRMHRTRTGKRLEIAARDIAIFKLLEQYRYLRSNFIYGFVGGASDTRFKERLGDLFHEGYLDRPSQQWQFANCRYLPAVYEIGEGGRRILRERGHVDIEPATLLAQSSHRQFAHSLMICEILASIDIAVKSHPGLRLISWQEILGKASEGTRRSDNPFKIPVSISHTVGGNTLRVDGSIIPDGIFGLEYTADRKKTYQFFAVEADRATMPVVRSNLNQSSYLRKILGYRDIIARQIHKSHLGIPNLLVLTVATNETHMAEIMNLLGELTGGSAAFLFKTMGAFGSFDQAPTLTSQILSEPWLRVGYPPLCLAAQSAEGLK